MEEDDYQSFRFLHQSLFYSTSIPGVDRLSDTEAKSMFNDIILQAVQYTKGPSGMLECMEQTPTQRDVFSDITRRLQLRNLNV